MHVARQAVATARNVRRVRVVIVAAVAVQRMKKEKNAVAVLPHHVKPKRKNKQEAPERALFIRRLYFSDECRSANQSY